MTTSVMTTDKPRLQPFVVRYELPILFTLILAFTWPFMIVDVLGSHGILPFRLPVALWLVMGYMPTLAAVLVTRWAHGRQGVRALLGKLLIARVGLRWYLFAIFGLAGVTVAAIVLANLLGSSPDVPLLPQEMAAAGPAALVLNALFGLLLRGIMNGEELAWRGAALPRLQARYSALASSLLLSIPWTLFHLPLFFTKGATQENMSFAGYAVQLMAVSILFTWLYNNTRGSVLLAYLMHAAFNTWTTFFSIDPANHLQGWMLNAVFIILAVTVVIASGPEHLSRTNMRVRE